MFVCTKGESRSLQVTITLDFIGIFVADLKCPLQRVGSRMEMRDGESYCTEACYFPKSKGDQEAAYFKSGARSCRPA